MAEAMTRAQGQKRMADLIGQACLAARARLLSRAITGIYDDALRPLDLKVTQMGILVMLARVGRISPGRLAKTLAMDKSTLSRNVDRLQQQGWLLVMAGEDERSNLLKVTLRGYKLIEKAYPLWQQAQQQTETLLGERQSKELCRIAEKVWTSKRT